MSEKEKRKAKNPTFSQRFILIASLMGLSLFLGIATILAYLVAPPARPDFSSMETQEQLIRTQHAIYSIQISGSSTAAVSHATETAEAQGR